MTNKFDKALRVLDQVLSQDRNGFGQDMLVFPRDLNALNNGRYIVFTPFKFRDRKTKKFNESSAHKTFQSTTGGTATSSLFSEASSQVSSFASSFLESTGLNLPINSLVSAVEEVSRDFTSFVGGGINTKIKVEQPVKEILTSGMYLYMPNAIEVSYGQNWETVDIPILGQLREAWAA